MFRVEVKLDSERELSDSMATMRTWLDHQRFEPAVFRHRFASPEIVLWVDFSVSDEATAFAGEFHGNVIAYA